MIKQKVKKIFSQIQNYDIFKKKLIMFGVLLFVFIILSILFYIDLKSSLTRLKLYNRELSEKGGDFKNGIKSFSETMAELKNNLEKELEKFQIMNSTTLENFQTSSLIIVTTTLETSSKELK
jgi:preprotein translocase subunit SecF